MKPTLEEMCEFLAQETEHEQDPIKRLMLGAIYTRLSMEQSRRQKVNRERRLETIYKQANKKGHELYRSANPKKE